MSWYGVFSVTIGIIYIIRPNLFRAGLWKDTSILQQAFSPKQYVIFMRVIGIISIGIGLYMIIKKLL